MSFSLRQTMFQPIMEQCAVRHTGQRIMEGSMASAFFLLY